MGVAALISWFVTAFVGLYLLAVWLIENDVTRRGAAASRLPGPVMGGHVLLALTGLVIWAAHLLSRSGTLGWTALGMLIVIAVLGVTMFTRWIPVHIEHMATDSGKHGRKVADYDFPAERAFPLPVVLGHGLFASTTFTLALLAMLGVGGG
jgi:hypothetical protein